SIEPDRVVAGCGMFGFAGAQLENYREAVNNDASGGELGAVVAELRSQGARLHDPELKKVPPGFAKDHPREELLRCKGLAMWFDDENLHLAGQPVSADHVAQMFMKSRPLYEWMQRI